MVIQTQVTFQRQIVCDRLTSLNHNLDTGRLAAERAAFGAICWRVSAKATNCTKLSNRLLDGDDAVCCDAPVACRAHHTDCKHTRLVESVHHSGLHPKGDRLII